MVARHEVPGKAGKRTPSRRVRHDRCCSGFAITQEHCTSLNDDTTNRHTVPYGTDPVCTFPRHSMPGYHHFVPPGRVRTFASNPNTPTLEPTLVNLLPTGVEHHGRELASF
jgi:hypothetical protein